MYRLLALSSILIFLSFVSLFVGAKEISISDIVNQNPLQVFIFIVSRIPRTITIILSGVGLSISGLIMQQITQNKFVSPTTAGALEGTKLGLLLAVILIPSANLFLKSIFAFVFTLLSTIAFIKIIKHIRFQNVIFIPLVGLMFGGVINSVSTFIAVNFNIVQNMNTWMMGDFSSVLEGRYEMMYFTIPPVIATYFYANRFTAVGLGEDLAKNIGLNYQAVITSGMILISITISSIAVTAGTVSFVGLVVPNIVSLLNGDNTRKTLPIVAMFGALLLLTCDIFGRIVIFPFEIPIGLMASCVGGIIFLILLLRRK
ncbi:ABC transporter permease [Elizabethkingia ursingii]|uniref:ABC transporter permease n=1 Tax=Elizabethkingia ursingii TaxID=1756150 RepID=UPI002011D694|nr:iron chelate uptake ABC transporter family permease subunit [Elizabethkingia ursingii]MCL1670862.1 iron chelate uptake ABC transporter family permease subunit [Elizabethkingia ursingii]